MSDKRGRFEAEVLPHLDAAYRFARWLTRPDNPLTWRSIANRVWHHHFGRGLVDTPSRGFGRDQGNSPF